MTGVPKADRERRRRIVREMWDSHSLAQIAERLGISVSGACRAGQRLGLPPRDPGRFFAALPAPPTAKHEDTVRRLWGKVPVQQIADEIGTHYNTVRVIADRIGLPRLRRGRPCAEGYAERRRTGDYQ